MLVKTKVSSGIAVALSVLLLLLLNQNCSQVSFNDLEAASKAAEAEKLAIGLDEETMVVGLNTVPNLKMFFVVDNSGTMVRNQLNLSNSFGTMFDAGSTDSLSKFDTTVTLVNTAQSSPTFPGERSVLDNLVLKQKPYTSGLSVSNDSYLASMRSPSINFGVLPGDNVGYQILTKPSPLTYSFLPAPVLGAVNNAGVVAFNPIIRKLASENSKLLESEFKTRLSLLNSERIPISLIGDKYVQENSSILDTESGLCAVARILRNPEPFIKSGDLLSFTIVTDENDNDPKGLNCIQSIQENNGIDSLVDGDCVQKQTTVSYQKNNVTPAVDSCKIDSLQGYNYKLRYRTDVTSTNITYNNVKTAAVYNADYTELKYTAEIKSYKYVNTTVKYFTESCYSTVADGGTIGKSICTVSAVQTGLKLGNFTTPDSCYNLAKELNAKAINRLSYAPVCTISNVDIATCNSADTNCSVTVQAVTKTVKDILGKLTSSQCLEKASTFLDYKADIAPICVSSARLCSANINFSECKKVSEMIIGTNTISVAGEKTSADCLAIAKARTDQAVSSLSDILLCQKVVTAKDFEVAGTLTFSETAIADSEQTIAIGAVCGPIASLAIDKSFRTNSQIPKATATCSITGHYKAIQANQAFTDCAKQAELYCSSSNKALRSCSSQKFTIPAKDELGAELPFNIVQENVMCSSKCNESKLAVCESESSSTKTVGDYLISKYGDKTKCVTKTVNTSVVEKLAGQLAGTEALLCRPSLEGIPRYFMQTKAPYKTYGIEVDYVAGTVKDTNMKNQPKQNLVDYIHSRAQELSNGSALFSALIRTSTDTLGEGGTFGTEYESLIQKSNGQIGSVLSSDYSVILKDLSRVIKSSIQRTMVLKKMRPDQVINKVYRIAKRSTVPVIIDRSAWSQNGNSLIINSSFDMTDGDQFKVEFQNVIKH